ncbi:MAG: hypothetical protein J6S14_10975 [Clostridia bacterium]|nr:hypothetical protein [Clostridia bacterium]
MKAQEYFEKYFADADINNQEELFEKSKAMLKDFSGEIDKLLKSRNAKRDSVAIGIVNEMNAKWNAVANKVEKKFGIRILKRNVIYNFYLSEQNSVVFPRKPD